MRQPGNFHSNLCQPHHSSPSFIALCCLALCVYVYVCMCVRCDAIKMPPVVIPVVSSSPQFITSTKG